MTLNPEDLAVTSFATQPDDTKPIIQDPNDPTANTWCYVCPAETERNCY